MEKRAIGVILTLLGVAALVVAAWYFINNGNGGRSLRVTISCTVLGVIFFGAGIKLVRSTKDVINRNEHVS